METKLEDILSDYNIEAPERTVKKVVCGVLNNLLSTDFSVADIDYQNGSVWVDANPMVRSQIHLHKQTIKETISKRLENRNIADIN
ncbi:MAG: hypothetical protein BRC24_00335 [Parcubacteria group bacterium SW_4_46_8]|nr:MAG: hypothetical protein BRC24_00335 [Parcubacteria group bacterium SW_4_46_8]